MNEKPESKITIIVSERLKNTLLRESFRANKTLSAYLRDIIKDHLLAQEKVLF